MIDRIIARLELIWPYFLIAAVLYIAGLSWLWWSQWSGAQAVTARLAVGDSARDIFSWLHTALSMIGMGAAGWFFLAPRRNWLHGLAALSPYVFTWALIFLFGANTSITNSGGTYKYCTFNPVTLVIGGNYDLSLSQRKTPPPYFDPHTGVELIPCADALRRKDAIQSSREIEAQQIEDRKREEDNRRKTLADVEAAKQAALARLTYPPKIIALTFSPVESRCDGLDTNEIDRSAEAITYCIKFEKALRAYSFVMRFIPERQTLFGFKEGVICQGLIEENWDNMYCVNRRSGQNFTPGKYRIEVAMEGRLVVSKILVIQ